ncbi:class I SAM-dependent methyltransferase [Shouchella clausii]|nr:class I SAM-dependent methyltransferase [Shouchella clausii]PAD18983.1 class I SAM-dependent methyltransferase [Shouchella clausii]PAD47108.1 class I SAM-dependent methyltransferase [Shouchella clausii]PAE89566.1 class I SAM-dependent methyltransferase [Shouchella clausii]PAF10796.1 class I SAM-dependent methyltransferase [Shouchella clausii]
MFTRRCRGMTEFFFQKEVAEKYEAYNDILEQLLGYQFVFSHFDKDERQTILDFGCGPGKIATRFAELFSATVIAVDQSAEMIQLASKKHNHKNVHYRLVKDPKLAFLDDNSIDGAFSCFVFITIGDEAVLNNILQEIYRVLKPGAPFVLLDTNPNSTGHVFSTCRIGEKGKTYKRGDIIQKELRWGGNQLLIEDYHWPEKTYETWLVNNGFIEIETQQPTLQNVANKTIRRVEDEYGLKWKDEKTVPPFILFKGIKG